MARRSMVTDYRAGGRCLRAPRIFGVKPLSWLLRIPAVTPQISRSPKCMRRTSARGPAIRGSGGSSAPGPRGRRVAPRRLRDLRRVGLERLGGRRMGDDRRHEEAGPGTGRDRGSQTRTFLRRQGDLPPRPPAARRRTGSGPTGRSMPPARRPARNGRADPWPAESRPRSVPPAAARPAPAPPPAGAAAAGSPPLHRGRCCDRPSGSKWGRPARRARGEARRGAGEEIRQGVAHASAAGAIR